MRQRRSTRLCLINVENILKHKKRIYVFDDSILKKKFINKNHDDFLTKHFEIKKIVKLFQKKYY